MSESKHTELTRLMAIDAAEAAFIEYHPACTGVMKRVFLQCAMSGESGIMPRQMEHDLEILYSSARRIIEHLGPGGGYCKKGLGLLEKKFLDSRLSQCVWVLTSNGQKLAKKMIIKI